MLFETSLSETAYGNEYASAQERARRRLSFSLSTRNCKWSDINEVIDPSVSTRWLAGKRLLPFAAIADDCSMLAPRFAGLPPDHFLRSQNRLFYLSVSHDSRPFG